MTGRGGPAGLRASVLDPWKAQINAIVRADAGAPGRRPVRVIVEELGITHMSETVVASYVSAQRRRVRDEARRQALRDAGESS